LKKKEEQKNQVENLEKRKSILPEENSGPPEIDPRLIDYNEVRDFLGQGSFGKVYSGRCSEKRVAVKVPLKQDLNEKELEDFRNEVIIMKKIFHPNCVLFMGACSVPGKLKILTELMHTDMEKLLKSNRPLTVYQCMRMAKDAALGLAWLHGILHIIHRDLKPANLLVDENLTVKITDFGFSQLKEGNMMQNKGVARGTPLWMSPEVMTGKKFNERTDVYSYGIILWQMITKKDPYVQYSDFRVFREAVVKKGERPEIPKDTLPGISKLITQCWDTDQEKRPDMKGVIFALDQILVDCTIANENARTFWKDHFLAPKQELRESIPWPEFMQRLQVEVVFKAGPTPPEYHPDTFKTLKGLLGEQSLDSSSYHVTMKRFNEAVNWFGCFFLPLPESLTILDEIRLLMDKDWFHGDISKDVAEKRLANRAEGTFLVRLSITDPEYPYTISMINNQHRRIKHKPGGDYSFKGVTDRYSTIIEMLENCRDKILANSLKIACPKNEMNPMWGYT